MNLKNESETKRNQKKKTQTRQIYRKKEGKTQQQKNQNKRKRNEENIKIPIETCLYRQHVSCPLPGSAVDLKSRQRRLRPSSLHSFAV